MGAITVSSLRGRRLAIGAGLAVLLLACAMSFTVFAHPGRTDSNGGHYDRETGEYHYHHGFEAHQHVNGECPFDFVDLTGQSSGNSTNKGLALELEDARNVSEKNISEDSVVNSILRIATAATFVFGWPLYILSFFINSLFPQRMQRLEPSSCMWIIWVATVFFVAAFEYPSDRNVFLLLGTITFIFRTVIEIKIDRKKGDESHNLNKEINSSEKLVLITEHGCLYHADKKCKYLYNAKNTKIVSESDAIRRNKKACPNCFQNNLGGEAHTAECEQLSMAQVRTPG